jgi:hypothetical protein
MMEQAMRGIFTGLLAAAMLTGAASAATVRDCDDTASARNIVEPWEKNARTYYKGQVRAALLDTGGEPACCSFHLLLILPPNEDEPGSTDTCFIVSQNGTTGYGHIGFDKIAAAYDAKKGLLLSVPMIVSNGDDVQKSGVIKLRVNVAKHSVVVEK